MMNIKEELLKEFQSKDINRIIFEGPKIVIYVNNVDLFIKGIEIGKNLAQKYKKRIEIRVNPKLLKGEEYIKEKAKEILNGIKIKDIYLEKHRSTLYIETYEPEKIDLNLINKLREETLCNIIIQRAPLKSSKIINVIRAYLHKNSLYKSEFLNKVGEKILERKPQRLDHYRIVFLGAGREVGRSSFLLQTKESNILLDCGLGAGNYSEDRYPILNIPEFDIQNLDAVIISHAHLDHVGFIPYLFRIGWRGPVYLTEPTRDIAALVLLDYLKVSNKQSKNPIFTSKEIKLFLKHSITLNYSEVTDITGDIKISLHNANHIIGSSMVHINIEGKHNVLYTGDYRFNKMPLLERPNTIYQRLETLIIESTYGGFNDKHPSREETEALFIHDIKETIEKGGKVLIPVLAVGRGQDVLLTLLNAIENKILPEVNIYLEGIVWETSMIHTAYPEFLSKEIREKIESGKNPFERENVIRASKKEREQIITSKEPSIIIATSGMMQGGPILDYFSYAAEDEKNLLAFVSYQAQGTLGRTILDGQREIVLNDRKINIKMKVNKYEGFSGHADHFESISFIKYLRPKPKQVITIHGEIPKPYELASKIYRKFGIYSYAPKNGDIIRL
ncbi:beta-CASP ribonuclease aCPSF1 [Candidatus Nanobsidianus stetteri]|uniref:Transcription termination factor FttA n=1 Tax=Nanobsidianus stetteri TaxID=1294122 RepID=A0A2T9WL90_NANST|nr:beta-CASP ribonuclease aCPSF1 [Candidatus Nanobsidianus stetteri]MCC5447229.1 beta-CASP ribonuclease aCPSF1 [Candidatus Nanobsidianus stetteri]